jgi:hypothetical protein
MNTGNLSSSGVKVKIIITGLWSLMRFENSIKIIGSWKEEIL